MNTVSCNDETLAVSKKQLELNATAFVTSEDACYTGNCVTYDRDHFQPKQTVLGKVQEMLVCLKNNNGQMSQARSCAQSIVSIVDQYQEDSLLLDPHVPDIASPLVSLIAEQIRTNKLNLEICRLPSSVIFILAKVCGYRSMSASGVFPHSFEYLSPLVSLLHSRSEELPWEVHFVLLLWLSVLLLLPFNLSVILTDNTLQTITQIALTALQNSTQSVSKAGALVLGRLLSRDVSLISDFLDKTSTECGLGILETLNQTLKMLPSRISDQQLISKIFAVIGTTEALTIAPGAEVRAKVLRMRIASKLGHDKDTRHEPFMRGFLGDRDYLVRWAAAKGLGRVGNLETLVMVMEIENPSDPLLFQGTSLAVAELIVRSKCSGFLNAANKHAVVALACQGLEHPTTVATWQVRDSASYIIWALARSLNWFDGGENFEHVFKKALLPALLTVCLFDREISCRRVAAAALQELVGRVGTKQFPAGMPLIETVDFWAVADPRYCFLDLADKVLGILEGDDSLKGLRAHFIDHLLTLKLVHPTDKEIRSLAARTLTKIIISDHTLFVEAAITNSVLNATAAVTSRQGGMEFLTAAVQIWSAAVWENDELQTAVRNVVPKLEKERLYRGKGGEMIRVAACRLIEALAGNTSIAFKPATSDRYLLTVCEGLRHLVATVQTSAAKALLALTANRQLSNAEIFSKLRTILTDKNENVAARRGSVLGLAFIAPVFLHPHGLLDDLFDVLVTEAAAWPLHPLGVADFVDAEARKFALVGLLRLALYSPLYRPRAIAALQTACEDFQVDQRGDVGSWVREIAISGLCCLAPLELESVQTILARSCERLDRIRGLAALRLHGIANGISVCFDDLQLAILDGSHSRTDGESGLNEAGQRGLEPLLDGSIDTVTRQSIAAAFVDPPKDRPELSSARSAWSSSPCVFRRCCSLLAVDSLQISILRSLVNTVGGVTSETVGDAARTELLSVSVVLSPLKIAQTVVDMLISGTGEPMRVSNKQERNNRFVTPVMNTLAVLFADQPSLLATFDGVTQARIFRKVADEIRCSRDVHKLRAGINLVLELVNVSVDAMKLLVHSLLNSPFPAIRHGAATGLYLKLIEEDDEDLTTVADILATTDWTPADSYNGEEDVWKNALEQICSQLKIECPTRESTPADTARRVVRSKGVRETPAYAELVKEEHW